MILSLIIIFAIFLPLSFGMFLILKRLRHSYIEKKALNNGLIVVNSISLALFSLIKIFNKQIDFDFNILSINKLPLSFGLMIDSINIYFLIYCALAYLILSIILKKFFIQKKQFIFTKQRFYIFLSLLITSTYLFFISPNLIQNFIFFALSGVIVYIFSYFDIFKSSANYNINRFYRILLLGDFCYLTFILILAKYICLSDNEIGLLNLDFSNLDMLLSYTFGLCHSYEAYLSAVCLIIALLTRFFIFPFNCFYSFFVNSSLAVYLAVFCCVNYSFSAYLMLKTLPYFNLLNEYKLYLALFLVLGALISFILVLFEKSYKIIFGYIFSILSSLFIVLLLKFNLKLIFIAYFLIAFSIFMFLSKLFLEDKTSLNKRIINKKGGFILERIHISLFETLTFKLSTFCNFINEKIIQNFFKIPFIVIDFLSKVFVIKVLKNDAGIKKIRSIFIIFILLILIAIFITLFGNFLEI